MEVADPPGGDLEYFDCFWEWNCWKERMGGEERIKGGKERPKCLATDYVQKENSYEDPRPQDRGRDQWMTHGNSCFLMKST